MTVTKQEQLDQLKREHARSCKHCGNQTGLNIVFGEGNPDAEVMFVGEGPGAEEDRLGRPFVGRAGQLLDKEIVAMGLKREGVYIANVVKTRPPGNRVPTYEEAVICKPFLEKQIAIIQPKVVVALGATAAKYLLDDLRLAITKERGKWKQHNGYTVMPTFHPAYLLRQVNREAHAMVWSDLKAVLGKLGRPIPARNDKATK